MPKEDPISQEQAIKDKIAAMEKDWGVENVMRSRLGEVLFSFRYTARNLKTADLIVFKIDASMLLCGEGYQSGFITDPEKLKAVISLRTDFPLSAFPDLPQFNGAFDFPPDPEKLKDKRYENLVFNIGMRARGALEIFEFMQANLGNQGGFDQMVGSTSIDDVRLSLSNKEEFLARSKAGLTQQAFQDPSAEDYKLIKAILVRSTEAMAAPKS